MIHTQERPWAHPAKASEHLCAHRCGHGSDAKSWEYYEYPVLLLSYLLLLYALYSFTSFFWQNSSRLRLNHSPAPTWRLLNSPINQRDFEAQRVWVTFVRLRG